MKKKNIYFSISLIIVLLYLLSCNINEISITSPTAKASFLGINDSCFLAYIAAGGNCDNSTNPCLNMWKNNQRKKSCNGILKIEGYTCANEYFLCEILLNRTMLCDTTPDNTGPWVPYGKLPLFCLL